MNFFKSFWIKYPALCYAIAALLGCYTGSEWMSGLLLPITLFFISLLFDYKKVILSFFVFVCFFVYTSNFYTFPTILTESLEGTARLTISSLTKTSTHFGKRWMYRGDMEFYPTPAEKFILPYSLGISEREDFRRPKANQAYLVHGHLKKSGNSYIFSVNNNTPWHPIARTRSLAEYRYQAKSAVTAYIYRHLKNHHVAAFLSGIATGEFDDRAMRSEFGRFGLQHITAISGFHFAIIAGILNLLIRCFLSRKRATFLLIFLLSSYFLFLGPGPSILRAWLTICLALGAALIEKRGTGLNSVGLTVLLILIYNPWFCQNLGFQFSALTTLSILLFYPIADVWMRKAFPKRSLDKILQMDKLNQHGYLLSTLTREAFALGIAVNVTALPMTLFYFQKFPWLSLIYNLFFPFMVSISMLLLMLGFIFPPLHSVNNWYTQFVLDFTLNMPTTFDFQWRVHEFTVSILIVYYALLILVGIFLKQKLERHPLERIELHYA